MTIYKENRITQRETALQLLRESPDEFIPVWWFTGEKYSKKLGWVLLSHKVPARLTELYQDGLVERKKVRGKTGAHYYTYKYKKPIEKPVQENFLHGS